MGGGTGAVLNHLNTFFARISQYVNPVGKFYLQFQILCRVLVTSVFLDDLFEGAALECDTGQPGCEQNCINRFAPVNHKKVWEIEIFYVLFTVAVFLMFSYMNDHAYKKFMRREEKKRRLAEKQNLHVTNAEFDKMVRMKSQRSAFGFKETHQKKPAKKGAEPDTYVPSSLTTLGYIIMLVMRLFFELVFLYVENELSQHQSQKVGFWDRIFLKENWICPTNRDEPAVKQSINQLLPQANRSTLFWISDENLACTQQPVTVTCWIPFSRMKSYAMFFMYMVLIASTVLTVGELMFELVRLCLSGKKPAVPEQELPTIRVDSRTDEKPVTEKLS